MRAFFIASCLAALSLGGCLSDDDDGDEDLGDIGDGKSDSFGIVDKQVTIAAGHYRRFTFSANASFRVAVTQPDTDADARPQLALSLKKPDGTKTEAEAAAEPVMVDDEATNTNAKYTLTVKNVGDADAKAMLNVRPLAGFGDLPNPNAALYPEASWQPPAIDHWPASYVIFNNTGCGLKCSQTDQNALASRSVMIKMLVAAIHSVKDGGTVRVSNFNISSSSTAAPVVDALVWAMQNRHATVKIVMDDGQNVTTSKTTWLSQNGAQVRFLNGLTYTNSVGPAVGIMHSKIVAIDDQVVLTGSNNFSGSGFVTNEENSVVLRAPENASRITSFVCDIDKMFEIGVPAGQMQLTDDQRKDAILALDACNGSDVWFPPTGLMATGSSITYDKVVKAIAAAQKSVAIAPDMMAHPGLVSALVSRAKKAKAAGTPFAIKLVLDASEEALGNPAFGECLAAAGAKYGLDIQVRYWRGTPEIFQLMHHKFMVIDGDDPSGATLYNGSANYSAKALKESFENVTRYSSAQYRQIVDAFTARFAKMFAEAKDKAALASEDHVTIPDCPLSLDSL
jgi:HKD family nuclease